MSVPYSTPTSIPDERLGQSARTVPTGALARSDLANWLVQQRNDGATPDQLTDKLIEAGYDADSAGRLALRSLRQSDHHHLVYWTLTFSAGFGALAIASSLHLILADNPAPLALACWITLALVTIPLFAVSNHWATRIEASDTHAIWSPTRRSLFATLATLSALVGLTRLFSYLFRFVAAVVGVEGYDLESESLAQVIVSLAVAVPLFVWALMQWRRSNVVYRGLASTEPEQSVR